MSRYYVRDDNCFEAVSHNYVGLLLLKITVHKIVSAKDDVLYILLCQSRILERFLGGVTTRAIVHGDNWQLIHYTTHMSGVLKQHVLTGQCAGLLVCYSTSVLNVILPMCQRWRAKLAVCHAADSSIRGWKFYMQFSMY